METITFPDLCTKYNVVDADFDGKEITNVRIQFSEVTDIKIRNFVGVNLEFLFLSRIQVLFIGCEFRLSKFDGALYAAQRNKCIEAVECAFERCRFIGSYERLKLGERSKFVNCVFGGKEHLLVKEIDIQHASLIKCRVDGLFSNWRSKGVFFIDCYWRPDIKEEAVISDCRFPDSVVYVSSWLNVCDEETRRTVEFGSARSTIDIWAELRDGYTGAKLYVILVLVVCFFVPYFIKSVLLLSLGNFESEVIRRELFAPLWEILLYGGKSGIVGWIYASLGFFMILYNVLRLWLTFEITRFREREEHLQASGFRKSRPNEMNLVKRFWFPRRFRRVGYCGISLVEVHKWLKVLFWISAVSAIYRVADALFVMVPMV